MGNCGHRRIQHYVHSSRRFFSCILPLSIGVVVLSVELAVEFEVGLLGGIVVGLLGGIEVGFLGGIVVGFLGGIVVGRVGSPSLISH